MQLTKQQTRIYRYLETYLRRHGQPPSYQEIREHFNFSSLNSVAKHLKQLERKGYLESPWANQKRAFRLLPLRTTAAAVPFLGRVAAGAPLEAVEIPETMEVPESLLSGGNNFALQVRGDSMVDKSGRTTRTHATLEQLEPRLLLSSTFSDTGVNMPAGGSSYSTRTSASFSTAESGTDGL